MMISAMTAAQIEHRIEQVKRQLTRLRAMHPGSLSEQYNVCGKPGCRCKDAKNPQKHGPYNQLSFTRRGQGGTRFVAGRATGGDAAETPAGGAMCDFRCQKMRCS